MNEKDKKNLRKLQLIELDLLKEVDRICKKHKITYYLGEGTLLGAVRHQGFIPWDDDIDVLMLRDEYERFLKLAGKDLKKQYRLQHSTTTENYWSPFIKIRLLDNSFYRQAHIKHLTNENGPCLDIFPVDNVPKQDSLGQKIQANKIKLFRKALSFKLGSYRPRRKLHHIVKHTVGLLPVPTIHRVLDKTFKKYNNPNNKYAANLASYYYYQNETTPIEWYGKPRMAKFEDGEFPIPCEAEKLLTSVYGDYMTPPPAEMQIIKHHWNEGEDTEEEE